MVTMADQPPLGIKFRILDPYLSPTQCANVTALLQLLTTLLEYPDLTEIDGTPPLWQCIDPPRSTPRYAT